MRTKGNHPIDKHVGSRVRMRRLMLRMSQTALADQLGITFQQVQKYEKGTNRISASRLQGISQILQVPIPFFFEGVPRMPEESRRHGAAASPAYVSEFLASANGLKLVGVFTRIRDAKLRRSIVRLVEVMAGQD
jgi:transcriptional regulator with XRE-family HTH domain